jgi:hypothetical protein
MRGRESFPFPHATTAFAALPLRRRDAAPWNAGDAAPFRPPEKFFAFSRRALGPTRGAAVWVAISNANAGKQQNCCHVRA